MNSPDAAIRLDALRQFPERPESEFEWEDLLLRLELMPRALRVELEQSGGNDVTKIVGEATARELAVQQLLEEVAITANRPSTGSSSSPGRMEAGSPTGRSAMPVQGPTDRAAAPALDGSFPDGGLDRFVRLRGRNFAMLQRRGIDVWNWRIRVPPQGEATLFQLLSLLARADVEILSRLRSARSPVSGAC